MDFRTQGRVIVHREANYNQARVFGGILFYGSLAYYYQRHFRANKSIPKFALFAAASWFAASEWSKFLLLPTQQEAVILNN